jgi:hypothetical protein
MSLYVIPVGVERITKLYHAAREMTPELRIERGVRFGELEHMYRHVHSATYRRGWNGSRGLRRSGTPMHRIRRSRPPWPE